MLKIDAATLSIKLFPAGTVSAEVRYTIADERTKLAKTGTMHMNLPESLRRQLALLLEDEMRRAKLL